MDDQIMGRPPTGSLLARTIVGRDAIVERLAELLEQSREVRRVVALVGEAGLGKSRLSRALSAAARAEGRIVLEGRASSLEASLPLGVMIDALRSERRISSAESDLDDPLAASLPSLLLPELGGGEGFASSDRSVVFEAAARYLRVRADGAGLVAVFEDLHWADPTTHALVDYLARTTEDAPILLVLTYRPDEDPRRSTLSDLRQELVRERRCEEIVLEPLGEQAIDLMLRDMLNVEIDPRTRRAVARTSGGNPFVVEELVRDAVDRGQLDPATGRWEIAQPIELPATVHEMVFRRVRALSEHERDLLGWAAILGERFDPEFVASLAGMERQAAFAAFANLREVGLVDDHRALGDGRLAFRHALTRDAVLGAFLEPERRRRHADVLVAAEGSEGAPPSLPLEELLEHALGAGDREKSLMYSLQAAIRSADLGGYPEARAHCERALGLWDPADGRKVRANLSLSLGYLTSIGGGLIACVIEPQSRRHFQEACRLYEEIDDRTSAALARAGVVWSDKAFDVVDDLRRTRDEMGSDAPRLAVCQVLGCLAEREFLMGFPHAALMTSTEGLSLLSSADPARQAAVIAPPPARLRRSFLMTSAIPAWWLGDRESGQSTLLALADQCIEEGDSFGGMLAYQALSRMSIDRPAEAALHAQHGMDLVGADGAEMVAAWLAHLRAQAEIQLGDWERAEASLERAEQLLSTTAGQPYLEQAVGMVRGELSLATGRLDQALRVLAPLMPDFDRYGGRIFRRVVGVVRARALLGTGEADAAWAELSPLMKLWIPSDEGPHCLSALLPMAVVEVAACRGDETAVKAWSEDLARIGPGPRADYTRSLVNLASAPEPHAIESAAGAVEANGRVWEGAWMRYAGALVASCVGSHDQAADLASAALERFRSMEAAEWEHRIEAMLRRLGRSVPSRRSGRGTGGLTRREVEVLRLVTEGASNMDIANCLFISKSTAIRHVANIFRKLDVRNRAEASRVARERGLLDHCDPPM